MRGMKLLKKENLLIAISDFAESHFFDVLGMFCNIFSVLSWWSFLSLSLFWEPRTLISEKLCILDFFYFTRTFTDAGFFYTPLPHKQALFWPPKKVAYLAPGSKSWGCLWSLRLDRFQTLVYLKGGTVISQIIFKNDSVGKPMCRNASWAAPAPNLKASSVLFLCPPHDGPTRIYISIFNGM